MKKEEDEAEKAKNVLKSSPWLAVQINVKVFLKIFLPRRSCLSVERASGRSIGRPDASHNKELF